MKAIALEFWWEIWHESNWGSNYNSSWWMKVLFRTQYIISVNWVDDCGYCINISLQFIPICKKSFRDIQQLHNLLTTSFKLRNLIGNLIWRDQKIFNERKKLTTKNEHSTSDSINILFYCWILGIIRNSYQKVQCT